jgi:hypothetical protein
LVEDAFAQARGILAVAFGIVLDPGRAPGPLTVRLLGLDGRHRATWTLDGRPRRVELPAGLPAGAALLRWSDAGGRPLGTTRLWRMAP